MLLQLSSYDFFPVAILMLGVPLRICLKQTAYTSVWQIAASFTNSAETLILI